MKLHFIFQSIILSCLLLFPFLIGLALTTKFKYFVNQKLAIGNFFINSTLGFLIIYWLSYLSVYLGGYQLGIPLMITGLLLAMKPFIKRMSFGELKIERKLFLFILFWFLLFFPLFKSHTFSIKEDGWYSGGGSWSDMALHSTYAHSFAFQPYLSLRDPLFTQEKTTYPFIADFYSGLLVRYGLSIQLSLLIPNILMVFLSLGLIFVLCKSITTTPIYPWIVSSIFFLNGSLNWKKITNDLSDYPSSLLKFFQHLPHDYSNMFREGYVWTNIISTYLLPQRGFLSALPAYLVGLIIGWQLLEKKDLKKMSVLAVLIGMLPLVYTHTFFLMLGLFLGISGWMLLTKKIILKNLLIPFLLLILTSSLQIYWQFSHSLSGQMPHFKLGWMKTSSISIWSFWLKNWGVFLPISIISIVFLFIQKKHQSLKIITALSLASFILTNLFIFQAYDWNNMKFMLLNYFVFSLVVGLFLVKIVQKKLALKPIVIAILFSLSLGGILSITKESQNSSLISSNEDILVASLIKQKTAPDSIFLTASNHNHPVPMLTGRHIVMGYPGWLWTYGINYHPVAEDINHIYSGSNQARQLLDKYQIDYVVIGPYEKLKNKPNREFFFNNFSSIIETKDTIVFEIN